MIHIAFSNYEFKIKSEGGSRFIFDIIRKRYVVLNPEEWVRQNILHYLIDEMDYPKGLVAVEKEIKVNQLRKRYDVVVFDPEQKPWMLIECKEPNMPISDTTLEQLMRYHQILQCPFWMLTNGRKSYCAQVKDGKIEWLSSIPAYNS